jgi:dihydrofolate reductase
MRKIVVSEFVSLDGVFEDPGGAEGTGHGGWSLEFGDEESQQYKWEELKAADALLLGRKTYEGFAAAWPDMEHVAGVFGEKMNSMLKYVVTTTLGELAWKNSKVLHGDAIAEIKKLKLEDGGDLLVSGSAQLVRLLLANSLVDKLSLMVHPVIIGEGKQLLSGAEFQKLKLAAVKPFSKGAVVLEYEPA